MKPVTRSFYAEMVQQTIESIARRLDEALDFERLATDANLSPFHFHRIFTGMVGETPTEFVRRLRLERAAWRLAGTTQAVTEVAFDAGFETHEAFTRAFRTHYDTSPSGFRERAHKRIELAARCGVHFDSSGCIPAFIARDSGGRDMQVTIKNMPAMRLGTVRHIGPYNQIPAAFAQLGQRLGSAAGELMRRGSAMTAIYYDDPEAVSLDQLRSDAAVVIPDDMAMPDGLVEQHLAAGTYACTLHVGPYEHIGDTWARFMGEWLPANGRMLGAGPSFEVYLNNPSNAAPADLRTEIYIPLA